MIGHRCLKDTPFRANGYTINVHGTSISSAGQWNEIISAEKPEILMGVLREKRTPLLITHPSGSEYDWGLSSLPDQESKPFATEASNHQLSAIKYDDAILSRSLGGGGDPRSINGKQGRQDPKAREERPDHSRPGISQGAIQGQRTGNVSLQAGGERASDSPGA